MSSVTLVLAMVCICSFPVESSRTYRYPGYYRQAPVRSSYYYNSYSPSTVGFTVSKTVNQQFSTDGLITFDKVVTNVGKAFQASGSKVTIPTTGLYYFSFSVRTNSPDVETIDLIKDGEKVVSAMGLTAANSAVVFARRGNKVSVNARAGSLILSAADNTKTSFSGFLIKSGYFDTKDIAKSRY